MNIDNSFSFSDCPDCMNIDINKEKVQTFRAKRKADFELAKANTKKAYQESPEFNSMINNLVDTEQELKSEFIFQLAASGIKNDLPSIQQVEVVESELKEKLDDMTENDKIVEEILTLKWQFPFRWSEFIQANPSANIPASEDVLNRPK